MQRPNHLTMLSHSNKSNGWSYFVLFLTAKSSHFVEDRCPQQENGWLYKIFLLTIMFEQLMLKLWKFAVKKVDNGEIITLKRSWSCCFECLPFVWAKGKGLILIHKLCNPSMVVIWPYQITSCQIFNLLPFPTDEAPQFFLEIDLS